jgi:hypothetical protein
MHRTHRKTPKGLTEIETRARGLPARMRAVLILVDGRRPDQEIVGLLGPSTANLLVELAWQNYIERVDPGHLTDTRPMPTPQRPDSLWLTSQPPLPLVDGADFIDLRERASRRLTDQLGPLAQALAQRMDATENPRELEPLLDKAAQLLTHSLGADAATRYRGELHKR